MVRSMTGYGRAKQERNGRSITVEVRSVNNRYLDCTVKMPRAYIFAEDAMKALVQKSISRGKVDVFVTMDAVEADQTVVQVNEPLARSYYEALTRLQKMFVLSNDLSPVALAKFPDVLTVTKAEEDLEMISADICAVLEEALAAHRRCAPWRAKSYARTCGQGGHPSKPLWARWRSAPPRLWLSTGIGWRQKCGRCCNLLPLMRAGS